MYLESRNQISLPLDIPNVKVLSTTLNDQGDYIITVESTKTEATCQHCGRKITKFHSHSHWIKLRHLSILGHRVYIRLRPRRYECPDCNGQTTTQELDWYAPKSPHTRAYDEYLMLLLINSTVVDVSRKEQVGEDAVEGALKRCLREQVDWTQFDQLNIIGIDEIALTKGHKNYAAIISSRQADGHVAILAVLADRTKESVRAFMESIPPRLRPTIGHVCTDMWEGYANAATEFAQAHDEVELEVVADRFHVAKNYRECVDTIRKQECRRLKKELPASEYETIKGVMWIIRQNHRDLSPAERLKLRLLFEYSSALKAVYTLREELTAIFELPLTKIEGQHRLERWIAKVNRSGLTAFNPFLTTLHNWFDEITNYFTDRLNSGFVEGVNNKIKTLKRRCYGILNTKTLFQRLYLDLEGYRQFS